MADSSYTYGVARIRAKEVYLFSDSIIEQLLACKDYGSCVNFLHEKGWGSGDKDETAEEILSKEMAKTWQEIKGLVSNEDIFSILILPKEFHNLKAAIKQVCTGDKAGKIYFSNMRYAPEELRQIIEKRDFGRLPHYMANAAAEATEALLQTRDGQLCDIIIDRATLEAMKEVADKSESAFVRAYANEVLAVTNIRIAVRSSKTGKDRAFMERAMVQCDKLSVSALISGAVSSVSGVCDYLKTTGYGEAVEYIMESPSAFERWCDNRIIDAIRTQKYNSFSEGPILAYLLARENEIKTVRIILTGKNNNLSDNFIRERVRKMYV